MFNKRIQLLFYSIIFIYSSIAAQSISKEIIARVGNDVITVEEFKERFELVPQSLESRKAELLYTLIAEKLWAQEAEKLGLDTTEVMKYSFENLKKMFARDALYKKEIESKVKLDEEEVRKVLFRSRKKINFL